MYLSDQMGLFLQKTNIIRDYLEDYVDGRAFWPQSVWKKYSKSGVTGIGFVSHLMVGTQHRMGRNNPVLGNCDIQDIINDWSIC